MTQSTSKSPVREGDLIAGKYRVERVLGVGGMGVVVAARHVELGELFALKFLLPEVRERQEICARFAREARTGIRIRNEHVARVFDVGSLPDGAPYMVMEHLEGEDLGAVVKRRGALPLTEAVDLVLQACEAICEAHQIGIVHRDLKPANLFATTGSDGEPFVKVLDFGISKSVGGSDDLSMTDTAAVLGSPFYMSPEQLTSSKDVDHRTDLWALGVILYELLTGKTPFNATNFASLCAQVLAGKYEPIAAQVPTIPPEVDAIVAAALANDREARIWSVRELSSRLVGFGSAGARASDLRISRIASRVGARDASARDVSSPLALAATEDAPSAPSGERGDDRSPMRPADTGLGLSRSGSVRKRDSGLRPAVVAGGVLLLGAAFGIVAWTSRGPTTAGVAASVTAPAAMSAGSSATATAAIASPAASAAASVSAAPPAASTVAAPASVQGSPDRGGPVAVVGSSAAGVAPKRDPGRPAKAGPAAAGTTKPKVPSADALFDSQR